MRFAGVCVLVAVLAAPVLGAWVDSFSYPDGPLAGNDGWTGSGTGIDVVSGEVRVGLGGTAFLDTVNFAAEAGNNIVCTVWAKPGSGAGESNIWAAAFNDASSRNYARWYGWGNSARPRIDGYGLVLAPVTLNPGVWNNLTVVVNEGAGTSTFYHDGLNLGSLAYGISGATGGVSQAQIENMGRTDVPNDFIMLDNMSVVPEPASLILLGLAGILALRRRA
jgi:hypothetical protein